MKSQSHIGANVGIVIIILILVAGALYVYESAQMRAREIELNRERAMGESTTTILPANTISAFENNQ